MTEGVRRARRRTKRAAFCISWLNPFRSKKPVGVTSQFVIEVQPPQGVATLMTTRHFGTSSESRPDLSSLRELSSWRKRSSPFDPYHGYSANLFPEYQCAPWSSSLE